MSAHGLACALGFSNSDRVCARARSVARGLSAPIIERHFATSLLIDTQNLALSILNLGLHAPRHGPRYAVDCHPFLGNFEGRARIFVLAPILEHADGKR